jgi:hypothetical protein
VSRRELTDIANALDDEANEIDAEELRVLQDRFLA